MVRKVEVLPHDPAWENAFALEAGQIAAVWEGEVVAVHHVGSTAISGIYAKPIIDLLVEVRDIQRIDTLAQKIVALGYHPMGEFGIPGRRFFYKGGNEHRTHHLHVFEQDNPEIERHLLFRDYMRAHPEEAQAYSRLKISLAGVYPFDIDGYCMGKDSFIREIDRRAAAWQSRNRQDLQPPAGPISVAEDY